MSRFSGFVFYTLVVLTLLFSRQVCAVSDGSGYLILEQTIALVRSATEQLKTTKDSLDISEYMKDLQVIKEARTLVEGADQLQELIEELEDLHDAGDSFYSTEDSSYEQMEKDMERIKKTYDSAGNRKGAEKVKRYVRSLQQFKRLELLKESHRKNLKKVGRGVNDSESVRSVAHSSAMTTEILISMEARDLKDRERKARAILDESAVQSSFGQGYRSVGSMMDRGYRDD